MYVQYKLNQNFIQSEKTNWKKDTKSTNTAYSNWSIKEGVGYGV